MYFNKQYALGVLMTISSVSVFTYSSNGKMVLIPSKNVIEVAKNYDIPAFDPVLSEYIEPPYYGVS